MSASISKVDSIDKYVARLDSKINAKVFSLDTKLDAILLSLFEVKKSGPSDEERKDQLDQLIFVRLKHTVAVVEQKYNSSLNHHIDTITTMLKVHGDMIRATNEMIK